MATQLVTSTTFVAQTCCVCGVMFALNRDHYNGLRDTRKNFYCPNGHSLEFKGKSLDEQLAEEKRRVEQLRRSLDLADRTEAEIRRQLKQRDRSLAATRGQVTKLRKRAQAGLCPYCSRHFEALERHICDKHKDQPLPGETEQPSGAAGQEVA